MHTQIPAVDLFPQPGSGRNRGEHGPFAHMLALVAVSLFALALTHLDGLITLGFWGSVRALAVTGACELFMLLMAALIVRGWHSARRK
ncbi:MAG TPA: hypothetical protein VFJ16_10595 [Longimicrobium sp.]|nr:hypothetical protein [Longimicrobium sp.]